MAWMPGDNFCVLRYRSTSGQGVLGTILSIRNSGTLQGVEAELGRFELLTDDCETSALSAGIAHDIQLATRLRALRPAVRKHVELNQNPLNAQPEVASPHDYEK